MELNVIGMVLVLVLLAVATGVLLYVDGRSVQRVMKAFMALPLDDASRRAILHDNAAALFHIPQQRDVK